MFNIFRFLIVTGVLTASSASGDGKPPTLWIDNYGGKNYWNSGHLRTLADVNNDGKADVVGFGDKGVWVSTSTGNGFSAPEMWVRNFSKAQGWRNDQHVRSLADADGDGKLDIIGIGDQGVWVSIGTGSGFGAPTKWINQFGTEQRTGSGPWDPNKTARAIADFDGDGKADVMGWVVDDLWVALSNGNGFKAESIWYAGYVDAAKTGTPTAFRPTAYVDLNGDGLTDIFGAVPVGGKVHVGAMISHGSGFKAPVAYTSIYEERIAPAKVLVGKFTGGPQMDIISQRFNACTVTAAGDDCVQAETVQRPTGGNNIPRFYANRQAPLTGDMNGDGHDDVTVAYRRYPDVNLYDVSGAKTPGQRYQFRSTDWLATLDWLKGPEIDDYSEFPMLQGDVNGDGKQDLVRFSVQGILVSLSK